MEMIIAFCSLKNNAYFIRTVNGQYKNIQEKHYFFYYIERYALIKTRMFNKLGN